MILIIGKAHWLFASFRVKSRASRPVRFEPKTLPLCVASSTTPPITNLCLY